MAELTGPRTYSCNKCRNRVSLHEDVISKSFHVQSGSAYMFTTVRNIVIGSKEERLHITGMYEVASVHCNNCSQELGWKYLKAFEDTQKYKEGKFVLELTKIIK